MLEVPVKRNIQILGRFMLLLGKSNKQMEVTSRLLSNLTISLDPLLLKIIKNGKEN
jgi:hypothetical protein